MKIKDERFCHLNSNYRLVEMYIFVMSKIKKNIAKDSCVLKKTVEKTICTKRKVYIVESCRKLQVFYEIVFFSNSFVRNFQL